MSPAKKSSAKKKPKPAPKKAAGPKKAKAKAKPAPAKAKAVKRMAPRADLGKPVAAFFAKQPAHLRPILEALRKLITEEAPAAQGSLKWGMPFYTLDGEMMVALAGFKSHVNLILSGPPGTYADPDNRLDGDGKTGRHLKLRALEELHVPSVRGWIRTAVEVSRSKARG